MSARTVSMAAPFRWLMKSLDVGRRNPGALFGALAILLACVFAMSALQVLAQALLAPSVPAVMVLYVVISVVSALVMPPLFGGVFRVLDATHRGSPVRAGEVFSAFRQPGLARQLVLVSLVFMAVYLVAIALLSTSAVGAFFKEYFALVMAVPPGGQPDTAEVLALFGRAPDGMALWMLGIFVVAMSWSHAYMLSLAGVALRGGAVLASAGAGTRAALVNFLPLLGFVLAGMVIGGVAMLLVMVVVGLLVALVSMVSQALGALLMIPFMFALMLGMYALMFGFYYHGWREIFGEDGDEPAPAADSLVA